MNDRSPAFIPAILCLLSACVIAVSVMALCFQHQENNRLRALIEKEVQRAIYTKIGK